MNKKFCYYRYFTFLLLLFGTTLIRAQTITTEASAVNSCTGAIAVPIVVTDIYNISAISLTLNYDNNLLTWDSTRNAQEELSSGFLIVNSNGYQMIISWFSLSPINFGDDTLIELIFSASAPDTCNLTWDLSVPDNCMYTDANYNNVNAIYQDGEVIIEDCSDIFGNVYYDNAANTAMNNTSIVLKKMTGDQVASTISDINGDFTFPMQLSGIYTFDASTTKSWGGVNSTDALGIMRHFVLLDTLQGIRLAAADVDASGYVNTVDALTAAQRFTLIITSFPAGDWLFWPDTVTLLQGIDTTAEIQSICFGDIDGSYLPPSAKISGSIHVNSDNAIVVSGNEEFYLPVSVNNTLKLGAVSLVLNYPYNSIEILDVTLKEREKEPGLFYSANNGELRIAWFDIDPISLNNDETLITLKCRIRDISSHQELFISAGVMSEFADERAKVINDVLLNIPKIILNPEKGEDFLISPVYPNPSGDMINFACNLPEGTIINIEVFDITGRKVSEKREQSNKGMNHYQLDVSSYNPGVYYLRVYPEGLSTNLFKTEAVIVNKR